MGPSVLRKFLVILNPNSCVLNIARPPHPISSNIEHIIANLDDDADGGPFGGISVLVEDVSLRSYLSYSRGSVPDEESFTFGRCFF